MALTTERGSDGAEEQATRSISPAAIFAVRWTIRAAITEEHSLVETNCQIYARFTIQCKQAIPLRQRMASS